MFIAASCKSFHFGWSVYFFAHSVWKFRHRFSIGIVLSMKMDACQRSAKRLPHFLIGKTTSFRQMMIETNTMQLRCGSVIDSFLLVFQNIDCISG
jgi:hypothetical protein